MNLRLPITGRRGPRNAHIKKSLCTTSVGGLQSSSPKPSATSLQSASTATAASLPTALIVIRAPGPAASIISPMIEVPPTVSWPRVTVMAASIRSMGTRVVITCSVTPERPTAYRPASGCGAAMASTPSLPMQPSQSTRRLMAPRFYSLAMSCMAGLLFPFAAFGAFELLSRRLYQSDQLKENIQLTLVGEIAALPSRLKPLR